MNDKTCLTGHEVLSKSDSLSLSEMVTPNISNSPGNVCNQYTPEENRHVFLGPTVHANGSSLQG